MWRNPPEIADFVTFTEEILNGKLHFLCSDGFFPAGSYMFYVNNRNTRAMCEICSKVTIKKPERRQWLRFGVFIVNFKHMLHLVVVFLLLTLSR